VLSIANRVSYMNRRARPEKVGRVGLLLGRDWAVRKTSQARPAPKGKWVLALGHDLNRKSLEISNSFTNSKPL
jgi:hypothetical protein